MVLSVLQDGLLWHVYVYTYIDYIDHNSIKSIVL